MRRLNVGIVPVVLLITAFGAVDAQTRTAPSIGDVVRSSSRVETRPGVSVRGVPLPDQRCQDGSGYGYDGRYDRDDRFDRDRLDWHRFDWNRDGRLDAKERKELDKARDKARKQAAKYDRKDGRYDRDDRYHGDDRYDRDDRFGCCTTGRYDTSRDSRVSGSRNSGTGTIDARRGTNNGGIYNGGIYNGSGRVSQSNGCGDRR
jgi:hypothetical protein